MTTNTIATQTMKDEREHPLPEVQDFRCLERLRVRWAEVDLQKIVFNGHYLMYFDTAVAAYWRMLAMPYHEAMHLLQGDLYVRKATLEYEASAQYDDQLHIGMRTQRLGKSSMTMQACAFKGDRRLVHGEIVYVFADPHTQTSRPIPDALRRWIEAFEAGESMVNVKTAVGAELLTDAQPLRHQVFTQEQGVSEQIEQDGRDDQALHAVAYNRLQQAVGTARMLFTGDGEAQIGRMAVLPTVRGAGVGRAMLQALIDGARLQGCRSVMLHAQSAVIPFYLSEGFSVESEEYLEAGIRHRTMRKAI